MSRPTPNARKRRRTGERRRTSQPKRILQPSPFGLLDAGKFDSMYKRAVTRECALNGEKWAIDLMMRDPEFYA